MNRLRFSDLRMLAAAAICVAAFAIAGCGEGSAPSQTTSVPNLGGGTPTPNPNIYTPQPGSAYFGIYVNPSQTPSPSPSLLDTFESQVGRTMALSPHYYSFYDDFPGAYEQDDLAHHRLPVDAWNCQPPNAAIAAGKDDDAIRKRADAIKAWGHPILLRYMWEMNLPASQGFRLPCYDPNTDLPNRVFSPQEFIAAWDRIRTIFAEEHVNNVVWLWNPSGTLNPLAYYPGNSEVDWVGFDKYDVISTNPTALYKQPYGWLAPLGKPILISETGANAADQPSFFADTPTALQTTYKRVVGFIYFDSAKAGSINDWDLQPSTMGAFTTMANATYFAATPPPL